MMTPVPTEWWLRPASRAARVGEQRAVVWNRLYFSPFLASRSRVGVGTGPPNVDAIPNPVSSVRMMSTFGEPFAALTGCGKLGVESLNVSAILPLNSGSGFGSCPSAAAGSAFSWADAGRDRCPLAASQPAAAPTAAARTAVLRDHRRMAAPPVLTTGRHRMGRSDRVWPGSRRSDKY